MADIEHGDVEDLYARLMFAADDRGRKLITLFGSGTSNESIPSVQAMTGIFRELIGEANQKTFDEIVSSTGERSLAYQNAASLLKRRRGDATLAKAIRYAVLHANSAVPEFDRMSVSQNLEECRELLLRPTEWKVPQFYREFAKFHSALPGSVRGPIITTNFDPLLEMAFLLEGQSAAPFPISGDGAPSAEVLRNQPATPILHMHGYWLEPATLNTASQLTRSRPQLSGLLRHLLAGSLLTVIGYSGWKDGFMASLSERIIEADQLNMEILWAQFSPDISHFRATPVLKSLEGRPGVNIYLDVDAARLSELFSTELSTPQRNITGSFSAPFGFTAVTADARQSWATQPVNSATFQSFLSGGTATWALAANDQTPTLTREHRLLTQLQHLISIGGGAVLAIGPMGEGKSIALRQVALHVADTQDATVLWREPGAPAITPDWFSKNRIADRTLIIFIDEADLVANELSSTEHLWSFAESGVIFALASQDRLWKSSRGLTLQGVREVLFHGLDETEALQLAASWVDAGHSQHRDVNELADSLLSSARTLHEGQASTLFGAVLDVAYGSDLRNRVTDMVRKLDQITVVPNDPASAKLSLVYQAIALMQHLFDPYGERRSGTARSLIAQLVGLEEGLVNGRILSLLGREAAVSYSADRVYTRHPSIARAVVDDMRESGELHGLASALAKAGAELRAAESNSVDEYRLAYLLCKHLSDPEEAISAATGAILGSPRLLESRVTYLSVLRRKDPLGAYEYAKALAGHVRDYRDQSAAMRAFLVEASNLSRSQGAAQISAGLAGLALADGVGYQLDSKRAAFALVQLCKSAWLISQQRPGVGEQLLVASYRCFALISSGDPAIHISAQIRDVVTRSSPREWTPARLVAQFTRDLPAMIEDATKEVPLPRDSYMRDFSFRTLRTLLDSAYSKSAG